MTLFGARNASLSTVPAPTGAIWQLITDPDTLAELTPLVRSIEPSGSHWVWTLDGIAAPGSSVDTVFTERMHFDDGRRITFTHDPPADRQELTSLDGNDRSDVRRQPVRAARPRSVRCRPTRAGDHMIQRPVRAEGRRR